MLWVWPTHDASPSACPVANAGRLPREQFRPIAACQGLQWVDGDGDVQRGQGDVQSVWPCGLPKLPALQAGRLGIPPPVPPACGFAHVQFPGQLPSYSQAGSGEGVVSFRAPRGLVWQEGLAGRPIQFGWGTGPGASELKKNRGSLQDGLAGDWGRRQHTPTAPQRRAAAALKHGVEIRLQPGQGTCRALGCARGPSAGTQPARVALQAARSAAAAAAHAGRHYARYT